MTLNLALAKGRLFRALSSPLCIILIFFSPIVSSAASLQLAKSFNLLAVNGKDYDSGFIDQQRNLSLKEGLNRLVIEYEEVFESEDDDNFDIIKSDPFLLEIYLNKNTKYNQRLIQPANAEAARLFTRKPLFEIVAKKQKNNSKTLQKTTFKLTPIAGNSSAFMRQASQLAPSRSINLASKKVKPISPKDNSTRVNKPLFPQLQNKDNKKKTLINSSQSTASKMLDYWWQQATPKEKEAFLKSIK